MAQDEQRVLVLDRLPHVAERADVVIDRRHPFVQPGEERIGIGGELGAERQPGLHDERGRDVRGHLVDPGVARKVGAEPGWLRRSP